VPQIDPCPLSLHDSNKRNDGWHSIEVFYGKTDHLERMLPHDQQWFSQARQDEAIASLLHQKRNGYFVDLAANDATILSNTYSLERNLQWSGLCIEPNPLYWANLTYRDCQVVAAIVGSQRMEEVFFRFNAGDHSGIAGEGFDNGKHLQRQSEPKYTVTLHEILKRFQAPQKIDYLSLDVEGAEEFILKNFPLNDYQISLMTVERPKDSLRALLQAHGFQFVKRLSRWGETLWAHESVYPSLDLTHLEEFTPTKKPKEEEGGPADAR
jgi:FkbM family methyltransferase